MVSQIQFTTWHFLIRTDDILRARLKTLGVSEHRFTLQAGRAIPRSW